MSGFGISRRRLAQGAMAFPLAYANFRGSVARGIVLSDDCGVASGCPTASTIVLWTRVPTNSQPTFGSVDVRYEVSLTEDFAAAKIVCQGNVGTDSTKDFTVKVLIEDLNPFTTYYYRFITSSGYASVVGRTKTAPAPGDTLQEIKIAAVSCQQFSQGYYAAYLALARENVDYCVHLGDHIYEKESGDVRPQPDAEATEIEGYRRQHRLYLSDPAWREVRRLYPWIDIWDDHEVFNDFAGVRDIAAIPQRVGDAYQAFFEYIPSMNGVTRDANGTPSADSYQRYSFGGLLDIITTDQRQYRTPNPCSRTLITPACAEVWDPAHTMLGQTQLSWAKETLAGSTATWKVMLNEVLMSPMRLSLFSSKSPQVDQLAAERIFESRGGRFNSLDTWDGYPREREELLGFIQNEGLKNVVMLTGDIHASADAYLYRDEHQTTGDGAAVEIVTTSISSKSLGLRLGSILGSGVQSIVTRSNPHYSWNEIKKCGYTILNVTPEAIQVRHVAVDDVEEPNSPVSDLHTSQIPNGLSRFV